MLFMQIMQSYPHVFSNLDAIALFGSSIRGDSDQFSDRDVLLISDDEWSREHAKKALKRLGFSSSCYDWHKLRVMSACKALFLQHLKQESVIIVDRTNSLADILLSFKPAEDYSSDVELTKTLISLTENFPDTPIGVGWALDILAVGFRNLAILSLANEGKYIFSYQQLLTSLVGLGLINDHQRDLLGNLRKYKAKYRSGNFQNPSSKYIVFQIQSILSKAFDIDICPRTISETSFQYYCLFSEKALQVSNWYLQTRLCEGAFMTWYNPDKPGIKEHSERIQRIEWLITNPSCYGFLYSFPFGDLRSELLDVMGFRLKKAA